MSTLRRLLIWAAASGMALGACASPEPRSTEPPPTSTTTTMPVVTQATPLGLPPDRDESATSDVKPNYDGVIRALPKVGAVAPDFTLRTMDGSTVTLSKLRGHPVLINFWASWCLGCRAEAPELQKLFAEYPERSLIILGVNVTPQDSVAAARAYVAEFRLIFPIPLDEQGEVTRAYHVAGLPTSFFVDRKGIIRNVIMGQMDRPTMLESLELTKPQ